MPVRPQVSPTAENHHWRNYALELSSEALAADADDDDARTAAGTPPPVQFACTEHTWRHTAAAHGSDTRH